MECGVHARGRHKNSNLQVRILLERNMKIEKRIIVTLTDADIREAIVQYMKSEYEMKVEYREIRLWSDDRGRVVSEINTVEEKS